MKVRIHYFQETAKTREQEGEDEEVLFMPFVC